MKKSILLILALVLFTACQNNQQQRYTQKSPEIETYKKAIKDYEMANWDSWKSHYADTAKIYFNATEKKPKTIAEIIERHKAETASLSSYGFIAENSEYEMVVNDKGNTWVNYWGVWQGRLAANNQLFEIPVHLTAQFVNGKIVKEYGYWDNTEMTLASQELAKNSTVEAPKK